jgi:hypothetical protein
MRVLPWLVSFAAVATSTSTAHANGANGDDGGPPRVVFDRSTLVFAPVTSDAHRGLNFTTLTTGTDNFYTWAVDPAFARSVRSMSTGAVRVLGGELSNTYSRAAGLGWDKYANNATAVQFNTNLVDWWAWFNFYDDIGSPLHVTTGNVGQLGNPSFGVWAPLAENADLVADNIALEPAVAGSLYEAGNETYAIDTMPFIGTGALDYPQRACDYAATIKGADPAAQVGLVVYEHGLDAAFDRTDDLLADVDSVCGVDATFDFFILHSYVALQPQMDPSGAASFDEVGTFRAWGVEQLAPRVAELRSHLDTHGHAQPIYVTESGLLYNTGVVADDLSAYNKGVAVLLLHHWLQVIADGADGEWYWHATDQKFHAIDVHNGFTLTSAGGILSRVFKMNGAVVQGVVHNGPVVNVSGEAGFGCVAGVAHSCWFSVVPAGAAVGVQGLSAFFVGTGGSGPKNVVLVNVTSTLLHVNVVFDGFGYAAVPTPIGRWAINAADWNAALPAPTVTSVTKTPSVAGTQATFAFDVPARGAVIATLP